jgi:hypothetical protein
MVSQAEVSLRNSRLLRSKCLETTMAEIPIDVKKQPSKWWVMTCLSLAILRMRECLTQAEDLVFESEGYLYRTSPMCSTMLKCAKTKYVDMLFLRSKGMEMECMETSYTEMEYTVKGCTETVCMAKACMEKACMEKAYKEIGCTEMVCKEMACMATECMVLENRRRCPEPTASETWWSVPQEVEAPKYDPSLSLLTNCRGDQAGIYHFQCRRRSHRVNARTYRGLGW